LIDKIVELGGVDTFVFDTRANPGGFLTEGNNRLIHWAMNEENRELLGNIYIAVDQFSHSNGAVIAMLWQHFVDDVIVIGTPTSGAFNFFAGNLHEGILPNSGLTFEISVLAHEYAPHQPNSALIPDIIVHRTLRDYINNHDIVMDTIRMRALTRSVQ